MPLLGPTGKVISRPEDHREPLPAKSLVAPDHQDYEDLKAVIDEISGKDLYTIATEMVDLDSVDYFHTDLMLGFLSKMVQRDELRADGAQSAETQVATLLLSNQFHPSVLFLMLEAFVCGYQFHATKAPSVVTGEVAEGKIQVPSH